MRNYKPKKEIDPELQEYLDVANSLPPDFKILYISAEGTFGVDVKPKYFSIFPEIKGLTESQIREIIATRNYILMLLNMHRCPRDIAYELMEASFEKLPESFKKLQKLKLIEWRNHIEPYLVRNVFDGKTRTHDSKEWREVYEEDGRTKVFSPCQKLERSLQGAILIRKEFELILNLFQKSPDSDHYLQESYNSDHYLTYPNGQSPLVQIQLRNGVIEDYIVLNVVDFLKKKRIDLRRVFICPICSKIVWRKYLASETCGSRKCSYTKSDRKKFERKRSNDSRWIMKKMSSFFHENEEETLDTMN